MKYVPPVLLFFYLLPCLQVVAQTKKPYPGFNDPVPNTVAEDTTSKLSISNIDIIGNKKTKDYIILREMLVKRGDSVLASRLYQVIEESRSLIYNTNLFSEVAIQPFITSARTMNLLVVVKERWYIFPTPQFKLVDRNFNEWVKEYNADLNRVIYGLKFAHYNFSGRGDQLRIFLLNGYARNLSFSYTAPYSNRNLTEGFSVGAGFTQNREFAYKTTYTNKLLQFKKTGFERNVYNAFISYKIRRGYFNRHVFSFQYSYVDVNDSVLAVKYNPGYFNLKKGSVSIPEISYTYQYINTDNVNYPLKGKVFSLTASKRGAGFTGGINMFSIDATFRKYTPLGKGYFYSFDGYSKLKLPFRQPYINQRTLGFNDLYLRGLEYYVIDGIAAMMTKFTFSKKIVSFRIPVPLKIKEIPYIPFTIYAKTYADAGLCYQEKAFDTRLNNRFLYTGGFGFDILSLYDFNFRVEYSFNQLGEKGLFLHARGSL
jgi:outer membrane protein assembly factor BamA